MAGSSEVAAFRAAGHSVAQTMERFRISERAVYKACQLARSRCGVALVGGASSSAPRPPSLSSVVQACAPVFPQLPDDAAGDSTYWRCPVTAELLPVVPGVRRHAWIAERKALRERLRLAPDVAGDVAQIGGEACADAVGVAAAPGVTPVTVFEASESESAGEPVPAPPVDPPTIALHKVAVPVLVSTVPGVMDLLADWLLLYWRVPVALALALLLVVIAF